ncbi:MAG: biopolymer transporter ExbD [Saprospiraceae bacterium]
MTDIIFLLLIFFIHTSTLVAPKCIEFEIAAPPLPKLQVPKTWTK